MELGILQKWYGGANRGCLEFVYVWGRIYEALHWIEFSYFTITCEALIAVGIV